MSNPREYRWIGSARETLHQLLAHVVALPGRGYTTEDALEAQVYALYESNSFEERTLYRSTREVDNDIRNIEIPGRMKRHRQDRQTSFIHFENPQSRGSENQKRRIAVHAHPERIVTLMSYLVKVFGQETSVYDIKIAATLEGVTSRLDNIVIYYYDDGYDSTGRAIAGFLADNGGSLMPGNPAMMRPLGTPGAATADQSRGGSWGSTRTPIIARAALALFHSGQLTYSNLVAKVEADFRTAGINPDDPSAYL